MSEFHVSIEPLSQCDALAIALAKSIRTPLMIGLIGTLGAGKTQWVRFFAQALGANPEDVTSPTFVLLQSYDTTPPIHHLDAYRINDEDELFEVGIEELLELPAVTIVEWSDRFTSEWPDDRLEIHFGVSDTRSATVTATGPLANEVLNATAQRLDLW
jgi:tRNA threonylcarbamoyladenosine biosynthesis protein TsaE